MNCELHNAEGVKSVLVDKEGCAEPLINGVGVKVPDTDTEREALTHAVGDPARVAVLQTLPGMLGLSVLPLLGLSVPETLGVRQLLRVPELLVLAVAHCEADSVPLSDSKLALARCVPLIEFSGDAEYTGDVDADSDACGVGKERVGDVDTDTVKLTEAVAVLLDVPLEVTLPVAHKETVPDAALEDDTVPQSDPDRVMLVVEQLDAVALLVLVRLLAIDGEPTTLPDDDAVLHEATVRVALAVAVLELVEVLELVKLPELVDEAVAELEEDLDSGESEGGGFGSGRTSPGLKVGASVALSDGDRDPETVEVALLAEVDVVVLRAVDVDVALAERQGD